jgi:predicted nucleic acid-binding protein
VRDGYLIDTNVISELRKGRRADEGVRTWFASTPGDGMFISVLTAGELRRGVERLRTRDAKAAEVLDDWLASVLDRFADRVLPLGLDEALLWGERAADRPQPVIDGLLAATAARHGLAVVTRNGRDFPGVAVIDPFTA